MDGRAGEEVELRLNSLSAWVTMETGVCEATADAKEPLSTPPRHVWGPAELVGKNTPAPGSFLHSKACLFPTLKLAQQEKQGFLTV